MSDPKEKNVKNEEHEIINPDSASSISHIDADTEYIKDAHATGIGALGMSEDILRSDEKEEAGIIKD